MDCDIYNGGKYNNFGIHGTGIATAADSLAVIKKYVFDEKIISKAELINAVDNNFENEPELLHELRFEAPKLGNNDDFVDSIATELLDAFGDALSNKRNCRGGIYRAGTGSAMYYLWHANEIGASPDGRLKGEPFGTNFSVSLFANVKGPVSVIASMTKQHFENAMNGGPLTLEFHQSVFSDNDGIEKVGLLVKSFIDRGGHQLQLNTVNLEKLLDAQKRPEDYRQLVVRIWGWSAYFTELDKEYQDHAVYLNCATLEYEHIPLKLNVSSIVLTNTNVKHSLGSSKYNERRTECEEGLNALKTVLPDITQLADVTTEQFEQYKDVIKNETTRKRIKHVVYECDRVRKSAEAMKNNDIALFGQYMNQSHDSLQYDYEVTCPELDYVVNMGRKINGVLGIRMTGAGFGGCTVAIIKNNTTDKYIERIGVLFEQKFGHKASFYVTNIGDGGREIL